MDGCPASWRARMQRPRSGEWVTYQGERTPVLGPARKPIADLDAEKWNRHLSWHEGGGPEPDPIADLVADLVRRFDPGGYQLQCPVAGCIWHLFVPRMELDPLELLDGDQYVTHVEAVPREDVELVLSTHLHWHAALTETATPGMEQTWTPATTPPHWEQQEWCDGGTCEHPRCLDELQRAVETDDTP